MQVKGTHHIALHTRNFAEMEKFYTDTLGFSVVRRWDEIGFVFIDLGSTTLELIKRPEGPPPNSPPGPFEHLALHVEDIDAAFAELVAKGVRIKSEPRDFKELRYCFFYDLDGNSIELIEEPRRQR
jgi:lactoylglutathione lyase